MGYGGDAHSTTQAALANYDMGAFYTKLAQDWHDVQGPDGDIPYTAPTYWGGGGPIWSGFVVHLPSEMYTRYGDKRILQTSFPAIRRWLAFLETKAHDDLLVRWGGEWDFLGDWLWPGAQGVNGDSPETLCLNNCYWVYALRTTSKVAAILGDAARADEYAKRAEQVRRAVNARFFHPDTHTYADGGMQYVGAALLADVPDESETARVWQSLAAEVVRRGNHIHAGITGGALLTLALLQADRADLMLPMVRQPDYPGWGDFLAKGNTTLPESWEDVPSYLHSSFVFVGAWFMEGLAGIGQEPGTVGFRHLVFRPLLEVAHAAASTETAYGRAAISWTIHSGDALIRVTVPPNSNGRLALPSGWRWDVPANLAPGSYRFVLTRSH
jgi:alpha-L-rhamnosidase